MVFLATELRPPNVRHEARDQLDNGAGHDPLLRTAAETGAAGLHVGGAGPAGVHLESVAPLGSAAARLGLALWSFTLPLTERPLPRGRRAPRLAAPERDERAAAIELAKRGLLVGAGTGARTFVLDFGPVALATDPAHFVSAFGRREMAEGERGAILLEKAVSERRARADALTDACLWSLEPLLRVAAPLGATIVLPVAPTPWDVPSPREAESLLATFSGAPIARAWDPGKLSVLCQLGLPISDERLRLFAERAAISLESDAVGLRVGYLPGLGERDPRVASLRPPSSVPRVILGMPDASDAEIAGAIGR